MADNNNKDNINQVPNTGSMINNDMDDLINENENAPQDHLHGNENSLRQMIEDTLQQVSNEHRQANNDINNDNNNNDIADANPNNEIKQNEEHIEEEDTYKDIGNLRVDEIINGDNDNVIANNNNINQNNIILEGILEAQEKDEIDKKAANAEKKNALRAEIDAESRQTMFLDKINTFNKMFKTNIDGNKFKKDLTESWQLINARDLENQEKGEKQLADLFKDTLREAFAAEAKLSYDEHRLPDYAEIVRSSNELLRVAMYNFTDLYTRKMAPDAAFTDQKTSESLFRDTAFGGLDAKEIAELTKTESSWSMDQKSDKAWEIQSAVAKDIATQWFAYDKPYDHLIEEMNALAAFGKDGIVDVNRREIYNKLAAAEWMLMSNEKMMIDDPNDPLVRIPNWGCKYWRAITEARDALGIPKHITMRELIQGDYAESSKAVTNVQFNKTQIEEQVLDREVVTVYDSMAAQKMEFRIQREGIKNNLMSLKQEQDPENKQIDDNELFKDSNKVEQPVPEENEANKLLNAPIGKEFIVEGAPDNNLEINKA